MEQLTGSDGKRQQQSADIDVVGISSIDNTSIIGECKFRKEKIDKEVYETLLRRSALISGKYPVTKYLLFSLGGFTKWFNTVDNPNLRLVTLKDMYS